MQLGVSTAVATNERRGRRLPRRLARYLDASYILQAVDTISTYILADISGTSPQTILIILKLYSLPTRLSGCVVHPASGEYYQYIHSSRYLTYLALKKCIILKLHKLTSRPWIAAAIGSPSAYIAQPASGGYCQCINSSQYLSYFTRTVLNIEVIFTDAAIDYIGYMACYLDRTACTWWILSVHTF